MKFFRYDSGFWSVTGKIFDLMVLNVLWFLTSLPIVTMGAASAALSSVTMRMARGEEPPLLRSYFSAFAANWKRATEGALLLVCLLGMQYVFPLCAEGAAGLLETLKSAAYLSLLHLPWSCLLALLVAAPVGVTLFVPDAFPFMLMLWIFLGAGGISFGRSHILKRLLGRKITGAAEPS